MVEQSVTTVTAVTRGHNANSNPEARLPKNSLLMRIVRGHDPHEEPEGGDEGLRLRRHYEQGPRNQVTIVTKAGTLLGGNTTEMAWEARERGGRYYTRSRREDGRVVREYVGGGALGELAALQDVQERHRRKEADERDRALLEKAEELAIPVWELCEAADVLLRAHLVAAGYARHKGEWRLKRG